MISEQAYALCMAIEELPASEMQTQISVMAAELRAKVAEVEARADPVDAAITVIVAHEAALEDLTRRLAENRARTRRVANRLHVRHVALRKCCAALLVERTRLSKVERELADANRCAAYNNEKADEWCVRHGDAENRAEAAEGRVRELEATIDAMAEAHAHDDMALTAAYLSGAHAGKKQAQAALAATEVK